MIPGRRKAYIKCPTTNSCATCKFKDVRQAPVISWDEQIATGYEPVAVAPVDEQVHAKMEYQDIKALMDAEDTRISRAFEMKELYGMKVDEIAQELKVSKPRIYQFISRARAIAQLVLCQEKAQNKVSDDIEKGRRRGGGKRGKGP